MIIRKTIKLKRYSNKKDITTFEIELNATIITHTWWFLFIPVITYECIH